MARGTATNFSGALQFPFATAATDLFKKEDVQTLAQAVDQHDHSSGKGLVLSAASIPNGTITSAMIADGTITTADIAPGSITSSLIADGTITTVDIAAGAITSSLIADGTITTADIAPNSITSSLIADGTITTVDLAANAATNGYHYLALAGNATTSTVPVIIPGMSITLATLSGMVLLEVNMSLYNTTGASAGYVHARVDSGSWQPIAYFNLAGGQLTQVVTGRYVWVAGGLSAGNHTFDIGWDTVTGTIAQNSAAYTAFSVVELRR